MSTLNFLCKGGNALCEQSKRSQVLHETPTGISVFLSFIDKEEMKDPATSDDIETGLELFHAVRYCPSPMVMKLFRFVDQLLSSESSRTIIQTFLNLFQSGALTDETSFTLAKQFYSEVASTLNLQYGNVLLATSSNSQLKAVIRNNFPFFANNTDLIEKCLQESNCFGVQEILQTLGIMFFCFLLNNNYCRWQWSLERVIPPPDPPDS